MKKLVLSGGPSTGKSTLFECLKHRYTSAYFVEEAAEEVINEQLKLEQDNHDYMAILPTKSYYQFLPLVVKKQLENEAAIPKNANLVFLDRSLLDNLAYIGYNNHVPEKSLIEKINRFASYDIIFFCDWLGKFQQNQVRREDSDQALAIHMQLEQIYHKSDVPVVHLPPVNEVARLAIMEAIVSTL